jgi:hypothetical protein
MHRRNPFWREFELTLSERDSVNELGPPRAEGGWRRSTRCGGSGCVEVAMSNGEIALRDSKRPDSPVLTYTADEWRDFIAGVKDGEFDLH